MGLLSKIFGNTRKPEGFFGRLMVAGMNGGFHAAMATWGLEKTDIPQAGEILDIGCGGGANIARLLARSKSARVTGVDYSPVSVAKSSKVNADAITKGRCEVREANVAALRPRAVQKHPILPTAPGFGTPSCAKSPLLPTAHGFGTPSCAKLPLFAHRTAAAALLRGEIIFPDGAGKTNFPAPHFLRHPTPRRRPFPPPPFRPRRSRLCSRF